MLQPLLHAPEACESRRRSAHRRVEPRWLWPEPLDPEARAQAGRLERQLGLHPLIAEILVRRGLGDPDAAYRFLHPSLADLESPWRLPGMAAAAARLERALEAGETIWVYGDYDVDGQTATALLVLVLRELGARVEYYVPHRLDEGYGLHREALLELRRQGAGLVVTVDCGITARDEVAAAAEAGLDVVVTDHHQLPAELPEAVALVNPRLAGGSPPWLELAGVGVAWKLAQALLERAGRAEEAYAYLDLVALGTVADVVPLVGENRILVAAGLKELGGPRSRPGLAAMVAALGLEPGRVTPGQVAFQVAPRLNAAGRVEDASLGVRLLLAPSAREAAPLVERLDRLNRERQALEEAILDKARQQALTAVERGAVSLVVAGEGWHPGVVGIVASRLVEEFYRPTLVIGLSGEEGRGSARSVEGFHLYQALAACSEHLTRFGGHAMAAGFSLPEERVPALREAFEAVTRERLGLEPLRPRLRVECLADPAELDASLLEQWERLGPFGTGNPAPLLATPEVPAFAQPLPQWLGMPPREGAGEAGSLERNGGPRWRRVGRENEHLKGVVPRFLDGTWVEAIGFHLAERFPDPGGWLDLAYQPVQNEFQGRERVELRLREIRPSPDDAGAGWVRLAGWLAAQVREGPILVDEELAEAGAGAPGGAGEGDGARFELVDERQKVGLPGLEEGVTFYTP
ncbi:MAG TPA: single-stranded-DNA-specific exonuclease RecJ, partial [Limnochorda sp.]